MGGGGCGGCLGNDGIKIIINLWKQRSHLCGAVGMIAATDNTLLHRIICKNKISWEEQS